MNISDLSVGEYTSAIADRSPIPGGGAVAATTLAQAVALGSMVIAYSRGKKAFAEHDELLAKTDIRFQHLRAEALELADADAQGFKALARLYPLAEDHPDRISGWANAVRGAISPPQLIADRALETVQLCEPLVGRSSKMLQSDLVIAARLAAISAEAAGWNVLVNLPALAKIPDAADEAATLKSETKSHLSEALRISSIIFDRCSD